MKNLSELAALLLPILFVLLCVRGGLEAISPVILPLAVLAFIALVIWLSLIRWR